MMENMQEIYQWGINLIKVIQTIENPALSVIIMFITNLGAGVFYMLALFFIIWCVDDKMGVKLAVLTLFSAWTNSFLKVIFKQPRPYNLDPSVGRDLESSYGFPSGHAQSVLVFFMSLASWLKKPFVYISAIIIILFMSFTRLYLGVHFPTDIFGGWIAGFIVLALYWIFTDRIVKVLAVASIRFRLIISAALSFIMLLLCPTELRMPGLILGLGMGYSCMIQYFPFDVKKKKGGLNAGPVTLVLRYLLGAAFCGLILFLGTTIGDMMGETSSAYRIVEFASHALLGAMAAAGVPWLFIKTEIGRAHV
jgi:membrane-associated phospholipid phosphatase